MTTTVSVTHRTTRNLPPAVPVALVAGPGFLTVLVAEHLTAAEVCAALSPLIAAHADAHWTPDELIA